MTEEQLKQLLRDSLQEIGIDVAGTYSNPTRLSYGDLSTDLSPVLLRRLEEWLRNKSF